MKSTTKPVALELQTSSFHHRLSVVSTRMHPSMPIGRAVYQKIQKNPKNAQPLTFRSFGWSLCIFMILYVSVQFCRWTNFSHRPNIHVNNITTKKCQSQPHPNLLQINQKFPSCRSQGPPFHWCSSRKSNKAQQLALLGPQVVKMLGHREKRPDPGRRGWTSCAQGQNLVCPYRVPKARREKRDHLYWSSGRTTGETASFIAHPFTLQASRPASKNS